VVICLEPDADLHIAQLVPLPLTVSFQYNPDRFTFLVPANPGSPGQRAVKWVCVSGYSLYYKILILIRFVGVLLETQEVFSLFFSVKHSIMKSRSPV